MMLDTNFEALHWPETHVRAERRHYVEFLVPACASMLVCPSNGSLGQLVVPAHAKRYLYDRLKGHVGQILGSAASGHITTTAALVLVAHVRMPWWKRIWWRS